MPSSRRWPQFASALAAWLLLAVLPPHAAIGAAAPTTVPILMYHYVDALPANADSIRRGLTVDPASFDAQLDWLAGRGFQPVTLEAVYDAWHGGDPLPARPVVLSFDDGYADTVANVGPRLSARGWPGVFFVITGRAGYGDYADWDALGELVSAGMEVDSHTVSHLDLTHLTDAGLRKELADARRDLQERLGVPGDSLAYPSGRYNARVEVAAAAAGYELATTTRPGSASAGADPLALPRVRVAGGITLKQFAAALGER